MDTTKQLDKRRKRWTKRVDAIKKVLIDNGIDGCTQNHLTRKTIHLFQRKGGPIIDLLSLMQEMGMVQRFVRRGVPGYPATIWRATSLLTVPEATSYVVGAIMAKEGKEYLRHLERASKFL